MGSNRIDSSTKALKDYQSSQKKTEAPKQKGSRWFSGRKVDQKKQQNQIQYTENNIFLLQHKDGSLKSRVARAQYQDNLDVDIDKLKSKISREIKDLADSSANIISKKNTIKELKSIFINNFLSTENLQDLNKHFKETLDKTNAFTKKEQNRYVSKMEEYISQYIEEKSRYILLDNTSDEVGSIYKTLESLKAREACRTGNKFYGTFLPGNIYNKFINGLQREFTATKDTNKRQEILEKYQTLSLQLKETIAKSKIIFLEGNEDVVSNYDTKEYINMYTKGLSNLISSYQKMQETITTNASALIEQSQKIKDNYETKLSEYSEKLKEYKNNYKGKIPKDTRLLTFIKDYLLLNLKRMYLNSEYAILKAYMQAIKEAYENNVLQDDNSKDYYHENNLDRKWSDTIYFYNKDTNEKIQDLIRSLSDSNKTEDVNKKSILDFLNLLIDNSLLKDKALGVFTLKETVQNFNFENTNIKTFTKQYFKKLAEHKELKNINDFTNNVIKDLDKANITDIKDILEKHLNKLKQSDKTNKTDRNTSSKNFNLDTQ